MSRKCSCFVIGVPRKFKEFNSVPRYKKGWEPLGYRVPKCDVTKNLFLECCTFGLKFSKSCLRKLFVTNLSSI